MSSAMTTSPKFFFELFSHEATVPVMLNLTQPSSRLVTNFVSNGILLLSEREKSFLLHYVQGVIVSGLCYRGFQIVLTLFIRPVVLSLVLRTKQM